MLGKNMMRKSVNTLSAVALALVLSVAAFAQSSGEITVTGQVSVNGMPVASNSAFVSGGTIVTGNSSTAMVSLGKAGRIEVLADSELTLRFTDNSITGILSSGKARVSNSAGVATTITTKDATMIADAGQANSFAVDVECSHTHLDTTAGLVVMRIGANDKQVAAGTDAVAGNLQQTGCKPCMRPGDQKVPTAGSLWLLLLAAAGVGAAIFFGRKDDTTVGGGTTVVSNIR